MMKEIISYQLGTSTTADPYHTKTLCFLLPNCDICETENISQHKTCSFCYYFGFKSPTKTYFKTRKIIFVQIYS